MWLYWKFCSLYQYSLLLIRNFFRVDLASAKKPRPLKILFRPSNDAHALIINLNLAKRNDLQVPDNFYIGHDRTFLEHEVLWATHTKLDQSKQAGESDLIIWHIFSDKLNKKNRIPENSVSQRQIQNHP